ncbi:MAG: WhiB family transcriptional regulator [Nigerium sp.]|nr:WhiB family transcriptional regulator [Nigerium sp.]
MTDRNEAHADALDTLHGALSAAVNANQRIPCRVPGHGAAWTSDAYDDRAEAAEACAPCPILDQCRDAGQFEPWGVWAGIDRSPTKRKPDNRQEISQ